MFRMLAKFDTFGSRINLNVAGRETLQTACGGAISVLLFIFFLVQATSLVSRLVTLDDPTISTYEIYEATEKQVNMVDHRMPIAFVIKSPGVA